MLGNLKAEYTRRGITPYMGIMSALGCSEKTARNKLDSVTPVTVPEACKIIEHSFKGENLSIEYLFAENTPSAV